MSPVRYLLADRKTGNWIIAEDEAGQNICLIQDRSTWAAYQDTCEGFWQRRKGRAIHGFGVTVKAKYQCTGSFCELKDDKKDDIQFPRGLYPINETNNNGNVVSGKDKKLFLYVGCGVGGSLVPFIILSVGMFCVKKRSDEGKRESIDENPDYGDDYYDGRTQVMDENDYYYGDI